MSGVRIKRAGSALLAGLAAVGLAACGEKVSTGSFKGEAGKVAQRVSQFQSDASKRDGKAICASDLAASLRGRLGSRCAKAIEDQISQIEVFTLSIDSIAVNGASATAKVKSTYSGKTRQSTLTLVREAGGWRISGLR